MNEFISKGDNSKLKVMPTFSIGEDSSRKESDSLYESIHEGGEDTLKGNNVLPRRIKLFPFMLSPLGKRFSKQHLQMFFVFFTFPRKQALTFHADNLHRMAKPIFWEK